MMDLYPRDDPSSTFQQDSLTYSLLNQDITQQPVTVSILQIEIPIFV